jgi:RHS repeat-associated protein
MTIARATAAQAHESKALLQSNERAMNPEMRSHGILAPQKAKAARSFLAGVLLTSTAIYSAMPVQALAQSLEVPPVQSAIDENGVDLSSGDVVIEKNDIDIGGFDGLFDARHYGRSYGDNHTVYVITDYPTRQVVISGSRTNYEPQSDPNVWKSADGGVLRLDISNGYALTGYTLTTSSGMVYKLTQEVSIRCPDSVDVCNNARLVTQVIQPNGRVTDLKYGQNSYCALDEMGVCIVRASLARLEDISDNTGRALRFFYESNVADGWYYQSSWENVVRIAALNKAKAHCNPYPDLCSTATTDTVTYATTFSSPNIIRTATDVANRSTNYTYDGYGRLISIQPPGFSSPTIIYGYHTGSPNNGRVSVATVNGVTTSYNYATNSGAGEFTATTTQNGVSKNFVFNLSGDRRLKRAIDALGKLRNFTYDSLGLIASVTEPEGNYVAVTRDARGNVTQVSKYAKPSSGFTTITASANFDSSCTATPKCNKPNYVIDERGNRTDFTYDAVHGGVTRVQLPAPASGQPRPEVNYSYQAQYAKERNSSGQLVSLPSSIIKLTQVTRCATAATCGNSASETKVAYEYSSPNLQVTKATVSSGDGLIVAPTVYAYDDANLLISSDGPLAGSDDSEHLIYDALQRLRGRIGSDPDGAGSKPRRAERYTYDTAGRTSKVETGTVTGVTGSALDVMTVFQTLDITFDANGNKAKDAVSSGGITASVVQYSYDIEGRLTCVAERMNPAAFSALPASACALGAQGNNGADRVTKYGYDGNDRRVLVQTGYGSSDQTTAMVVSYTANGKPAYIVDAEVNRTTYEYDGHDRPFRTLYPLSAKGANASSNTDYEQLTYDDAGNITSRRLRDGTSFTYVYDDLNRMTVKGPPNPDPTTHFSYDNFGRLLTATKTTGQSLSLSYDALGRNLTQTGPQGTICSNWDLAGRRVRLVYAGSCTSPTLWMDYDYLVTGEMTKIRENGATSGIGVLATYAYDDVGRRTSLTFGNGTSQSFGYDVASRPSSITANLAGTANDLTIDSISYNPVGQITGQDRSNDAYAWTGSVVVNRDYTSNGLNRYTTSGSIVPTYDDRGNLKSTGPLTYGYNSENGLSYVSGGAWTTLYYDPAMRLQEVTVGASSTRFAYDGSDLIAEYDGSDLLLRRYVHGPGTDQPLVQYEGSGTADRRFLHADERRSAIAVTDGSGNLIASNGYDEYGIPNSGNYGRFQYTGQAWLPELGMYYYKARIYSPTLGRFLQTDPIGYTDGLNWYNYVGSDPINRTDPLGTDGTIVVTGSPQWLIDLTTEANLAGVIASIHSAFNDQEVANNFTMQLAALAAATAQRLKKNCDGVPGFAQFQIAAQDAILANPQDPYVPAWLRGIFIHSTFSSTVRNFDYTHVNVSYQDGTVAGWLDLGSIRPDAVYGNINKPDFVIELKTSNARLTDPQLSNYQKNLPPHTLICEIHEKVLDFSD